MTDGGVPIGAARTSTRFVRCTVETCPWCFRSPGRDAAEDAARRHEERLGHEVGDVEKFVEDLREFGGGRGEP